MDPFYDELFKHWNVRLRRSTLLPAPPLVEVDDSDTEDDLCHWVVKADPYSVEVNGEQTKDTTTAHPVEPAAPSSQDVLCQAVEATDVKLEVKPFQKGYQDVMSLSKQEVEERIAYLKTLGCVLLLQYVFPIAACIYGLYSF